MSWKQVSASQLNNWVYRKTHFADGSARARLPLNVPREVIAGLICLNCSAKLSFLLTINNRLSPTQESPVMIKNSYSLWKRRQVMFKNMRSYQTRIPSIPDNPLPDYACLMARVEHCLFADIARGKKSGDLNSFYLTRLEIPARQYNSVSIILKCKITSIKTKHF